jgi:hypothetical protein
MNSYGLRLEVNHEMKDTMPTWPQTLLITALGMGFCAVAYFLSHMRDNWGASAWALLLLLVSCGVGFMLALFFFYLRPQYGPRAFPALVFMLLGHAALIAILVKMGIA